MSPQPVIQHQDTNDCSCPACLAKRAMNYGYEDPLAPARGILAALAFSLAGALVILALAWLIVPDSAWPRPNTQPQPVAAPTALLKARAACPNTATRVECRTALLHAYASVEWQRKARKDDARRARGYGVMHALRLASALYNVPLHELVTVASCESNLHPQSRNTTSTASGVFQFLDSTWNRAGVPGFSVFDPYANATAAARLVKNDGSWREWSCKP